MIEPILLSAALAMGVGSLLEDIEPTAAVDMRAESRVRPAGVAQPDSFASGEVEIVPAAMAGFRVEPISLALRYAPSVTFTTYDPLSEPLILHQGMGRAMVEIGGDLRLSLAHLRQHGERNFTAAIAHDEWGGRRLRLEFLPDVERLPIAGHFTLAGLVFTPSRWNEYRILGTYGSYGGRGEWALRRLPKQSGPRLALEGDIGVGALDQVLARVRASRTVFEPGPNFIIGEAEGGWRRQYDRRTSVAGLLGVFAGYNEDPVGFELRSVVLPTLRAELSRERGSRARDGVLEIALEAAPRINQLEATLDPRVTVEAGLEWSRRKLEGRFDLGHAWVLDEDLLLGGRILAMGSTATLPMGDYFEVEAGMRLFRQQVRFGVGWWGAPGWYWDVFAAITFRTDLVERR